MLFPQVLLSFKRGIVFKIGIVLVLFKGRRLSFKKIINLQSCHFQFKNTSTIAKKNTIV